MMGKNYQKIWKKGRKKRLDAFCILKKRKMGVVYASALLSWFGGVCLICIGFVIRVAIERESVVFQVVGVKAGFA